MVSPSEGAKGDAGDPTGLPEPRDILTRVAGEGDVRQEVHEAQLDAPGGNESDGQVSELAKLPASPADAVYKLGVRRHRARRRRYQSPEGLAGCGGGVGGEERW